MKIKDIGLKTSAAYILLGLGYATIIGFTYMQYVYYDAMIEVLGITNAQLGFLITIVAIGAVFTALPGGVLVDKFDCKKILTISLGITAALCVWFALEPTYTTALYCWTGLAFTMSGYYPAIFKIIRIIASENKQGSSFGFFGIATAIGYMVVNFTSLKLYDLFSATSAAAGMSAVMWVFASIATISTIFGYLLIKDMEDPEQGTTSPPSFTKKDLIEILHNPGTWLLVLLNFSVYSLHISMSYFTPYFTNVLGTALVFSGLVAVIRQYCLRIISSPLGGWYGDKIRSTAQVIQYSFIGTVLLILTIILIPQTTPIAFIIILVMILGLLDNMNISLVYSTVGEALVPRKHMGTVVGVATTVSPDLFQETFFGHILDVHGNAGYNYIFFYTIVMCFLGIIITRIIKKRNRKHLGT